MTRTIPTKTSTTQEMAAGGRGVSFFLPFAALNLAIRSDGSTVGCEKTRMQPLLGVRNSDGELFGSKAGDRVRIEADGAIQMLIAAPAAHRLPPRRADARFARRDGGWRLASHGTGSAAGVRCS